ncbi:hypothetical protein RKD23_007627 [Streptomyces sp. SAI-170]
MWDDLQLSLPAVTDSLQSETVALATAHGRSAPMNACPASLAHERELRRAPGPHRNCLPGSGRRVEANGRR